ncbi:MAG: hypothetical protein JWN66_464 [Sphingomonas bacterium]|jgi:hypothetical protein|uniref:hypothetical protein n=1 Tax=Sphingomonas bacterium TaxID=1895847 RepID=UPI002639719F|nr:hypothetical protein [Sphingomonas bacterium]MDB5703348.1 hypothetical protein [Sphingomonas bacterium]
MSIAFAPPAAALPVAASAIIDAARSWRIARDSGLSIQPALYARLEARGYGPLAPVLDGLLTLFEAGFRRHFRAGDPSDSAITGDERQLLALLEDEESAPQVDYFRADLAGAMRIAVRSSRIMLRLVIRQDVRPTQS